MSRQVAVVILAAGKSTRMKSQLPKVLHPLCGRPMISYVFDAVKAVRPAKTIIVLGHKAAEVRAALPRGVQVVLQKEILGTADAVKRALPKLTGFKGTVLILYGDTPLLTTETVNSLLEYHREAALDVTLLTALIDKPAQYGRILRDKYACISGIVEAKDASDYQKEIKEINTGIMCFSSRGLAFALKRITPQNRTKEFYLTDAVDLLYRNGFAVGGVRTEHFSEAMGINSRVELAEAQRSLQKKTNERVMQDGVTMISPETVFLAADARIGEDTVLYPFVVVESGAVVGKNCRIGPFAHIAHNARVKDNAIVRGTAWIK